MVEEEKRIRIHSSDMEKVLELCGVDPNSYSLICLEPSPFTKNHYTLTLEHVKYTEFKRQVKEWHALGPKG